jgi:hypothetical protein
MRATASLLGIALAVVDAASIGAQDAAIRLPHAAALPDPLIMVDGARAVSADQWQSLRKPQLRRLFEHEMYGRYPAKPERVSGKTLFEDSVALDGTATLREVEIAFGPPEWPKLYLLIATPNGKRPAACFLGANFGGNHLRVREPRVRVPTAWMPAGFPGVVDGRATEAGRGKQDETWDQWPLADIVSRGYAVATFYCGDIQPDRPGAREGMRATRPSAGGTPDPAETGAIMWWAWGIHRAVDYLANDPRIDAQRIAVIGHSRLGKTALVAGAFDERIALVIPHQAGCGGSGPSRHNDSRAETVAIITEKFPHWFCDNFKSYGDDPTRLPFDQNCLVALCAPRPVLFTSAAEDLWANPAGQFEVLKAAAPVYELLGVEGLTAKEMPRVGDPLVAGRLGYWIRPGTHALLPADWRTFMDFADKWLR